MKKFLTASASAIALLGLAACGDTDDMTTQGVEPEVQEDVAPADPAMDEPAVDEETTQSIEGDEEYRELETEEPQQ